MIRYRRLYESESDSYKIGDVIDYAGHEWYIIGKQDNTVTLFIKNKDFNRYFFHKKSYKDGYRNPNDYKTSAIRKHLHFKILPELIKNGAKPIPTNLPDVDCTDKIWLLSREERENLPDDVAYFPNDIWWLRSPGENSDSAAISLYSGDSAKTSTYFSVRPAIRVRIEDLEG